MNILELANQIGLDPKWVAGTAGGEYHSSCPNCGGKDRFFIQPFKQMHKCVGTYCCRRCGIAGDSIKFAMNFLNYSFQESIEKTNGGIPRENYLHKIKRINVTEFCKLKISPHEWIYQANELVDKSHQLILKKPDILNYLSSRGLPIEAVKKYKLGWIDQDQFFSREVWGLKSENYPNQKDKKLWIPKGLLIPTSEFNGDVIRLKVRRFDWKEGDNIPKYIAISGSKNGLNIIGSTSRSAMIVVESELDSYAIHHVANDFAFVVAVGSNIKNPDILTNSHAKKSQNLIICYDTDLAGQKMLEKWQKFYPHCKAYPTPIGKDIGEAIQKGLNLRAWLIQALSKQAQYDLGL